MFLIQKVLFICLCFLLAGCVAKHQPASLTYTTKKFSAPLGQELKADTGGTLFLEGSYIPGEYILVPNNVDIMVPGSMLIPFPVHIDSGRLVLNRISSNWRYYCAEEGKAAASFPGLGSVIARGDCVGIRVSSDKKEKQWVVDNSNYNHMNTVWSRSLGKDDDYPVVESDKPFKIERMRRIVFDGYYGKQLHFTWEESTAHMKETKEFVFDFVGSPTSVGIKGNLFSVISANNIQLVYKWIKLK